MPDLRRLAKEGLLVGYFGYGSLVNRATLRTPFLAAFPARLSGWRRFWQGRPERGGGFAPVETALLSAGRSPGAAIDGLVVIDHVDHLPAVDRREALYRRQVVAPEAVAYRGPAPCLACPVFIYEALPPAADAPPAFILRSYLDAVMQGFLAEFGQAGLARFVAETEGFHLPFHEDRAEPVYPRAVRIGAEDAALFDALLARRDGRRTSPATGPGAPRP